MGNQDISAVWQAVEALLSSDEKTVLIGIDGDCAAGKSTLGALIKEKYGGNIFHADDYFLPPEKRTAERLSEPGGNMERERLLAEVLLPVSEGRAAVVYPFDCHTMSLGHPKSYEVERLNIVEGSYCLHPELSGFYDLKIALRISPEVQRERILRRNGAEGLSAFDAKWIPLEKRYFSYFGILESADIVI